MNGRVAALLLFAIGASIPAACSSPPPASSFERGATRVEIVERFGEPDRKQDFVKRDEAIWGPIEEFWARVPLGSSVAIWSYRVHDGLVELYFVDGSPTVDGLGFAPEGAVFESDE